MQTNTLVQASAKVVTITTLTAGDVYKRLVKPTYSDEYKASYGVVQTVDHNGEDAMVTAIEVSEDGVTHKVFGTNSNLQIFAATPEEIAYALNSRHDTLDNRRRDLADRLAAADREIEAFDSLRAQVEDRRLTIPTTATPAITA